MGLFDKQRRPDDDGVIFERVVGLDDVGGLRNLLSSLAGAGGPSVSTPQIIEAAKKVGARKAEQERKRAACRQAGVIEAKTALDAAESEHALWRQQALQTDPLDLDLDPTGHVDEPDFGETELTARNHRAKAAHLHAQAAVREAEADFVDAGGSVHQAEDELIQALRTAQQTSSQEQGAEA